MSQRHHPLLEIGLLLSAVHACLWLGVVITGTVLVGLGVGMAALLEPATLLPAGVFGGLAGILLSAYASCCILTLYACYAVYRGSRAWAWALLLLSVVGLMDLGLLSTPARLITILGLASWLLGREEPAEAALGRDPALG